MRCCFRIARRLNGVPLMALVLTAYGCSAGGMTRSFPSNRAATNDVPQENPSLRRAVSLNGSSNAYQSSIEQAGPSAYYTLADSTSILADSGPSKLNGTYGALVRLGAQTFDARSGPAAVFPGGSQYSDGAVARVSIAPALQPQQLSIEAWITPSVVNTTEFFAPIVSYGSEDAGQPYVLQVSPQNTANFWTKTDMGSAQVQGSTYLSAGQTYHIVVTDNGSQIALHVNGRLDGTASGHGYPSYTNLLNCGLTIGGAAQSMNRAIFNGAIDDVAVYSTALSASTIAAHYALGTTRAWPYESETPLSADGFADSFGVVLHLHYQDSPYDLQFESVKSRLIELGVRHIGDFMYADNWQPYKDRLEELAQAGIHSTLGTNQSTTSTEVVNYPALVPGSMEAVEGYNEPEISGDPTWVAHTIAWQQKLYQTVKSNAATSNLAVLGPAVVYPGANTDLGDLSQWMDYGDSHIYWSARNPETLGWGNGDQWGTYGSLDWDLNWEAVMSGKRPHRISETGWGTGNFWLEVSPATQAKYLARLYLDLYGRGVNRSTMYQFIDDKQDSFGYYGLVDYSLNRKPSFYEMKSLLGLLSDRGPNFYSTKFNFHLGGNSSHLEHLTMQKRNGKTYIAFWLGVQSCDPTVTTVCADHPVPPQRVTLSTQATPSAATLYTFDANGTMNSSKLAFSGNVTSLNVTDQVSVVEVDP